MHFESLNADLRHWLKTSIDGGHDRDTLLQALHSVGYDEGFARLAVAAALSALQPDEAGAPQPEPVPSSGSALAGKPNTIATSDRAVDILMALDSPRVVLFGNLLSVEECEQLIEASRLKLQRSTVVNAATGDYEMHPDRTSTGTHFERAESPLIARIERRISELVDHPIENGEPLQVLHYLVGGEYKPHYDYFDPKQSGNDKVLAMGGQRVATLVMYLNDVVAGGSTVFPAIGLDVLPRRGSAVYFAYTTDAGETDSRSLHGGSPVVAGEKWIATKWLRQRRYGAST